MSNQWNKKLTSLMVLSDFDSFRGGSADNLSDGLLKRGNQRHPRVTAQTCAEFQRVRDCLFHVAHLVVVDVREVQF